MEEQRCAIVTGGNKGIGFEICRQLASNGIKVILTARNESRGDEAVKKLIASGLSNIVFHQLDVKDPTSVAHLAEFVETHFKKLDILVNNAGESGAFYEKSKDGGGIKEPYEMGEECLKTNYYGTKRVTEALIPLLRLSKSPRIVNVSSSSGDLHWFSNEKLKEELNDIENLTEERIDEIIQWFLRDFKDGRLSENGWPLKISAYKVSKATLNAYTRLMARKLKNILVNCASPGHCVTDMTYHTGIQTAEEGAKCIVKAALLPDDGPSGVLFYQMEIAPFSGLKSTSWL